MPIFARIASTFALLLCPILMSAQTGPALFDWTSFREIVLQNHPIAQQAALYNDAARAALLRAKGGFDPKTYANYDTKHFDKKQYFQHTELGVKLPTWYGLELKSAYNLAQGQFLNPEDELPNGGQASFGLNWTLGQGLMIDERRAERFSARIGLQLGEAERNATLNALMFEAGKSYWAWVVSANQIQVIQDAFSQAQIRHEAIRESFVNGERSAMDTLETFILVQNRSLDLNFARIEFQNAAIEMSNYLWDSNRQPNLPAADVQLPVLLTQANFDQYDPAAVDALLNVALNMHPVIQAYQGKLGQLDVERRLKNEKRKPVVDLEYYLLGSGWQFFSTPSDGNTPGILGRDIKAGISVSYPIPNRKARGDLQVTQIKIAQNEYQLTQKRQEIEAKLKQYANELNNLAAQIRLYRDMVTNYRQLLDFESERFRFGESSVFLINTREQRWLDAQIKYLKLVGEYQKATAGLQWASGRW